MAVHGAGPILHNRDAGPIPTETTVRITAIGATHRPIMGSMARRGHLRLKRERKEGGRGNNRGGNNNGGNNNWNRGNRGRANFFSTLDRMRYSKIDA
jgi:hypothetical protein